MFIKSYYEEIVWFVLIPLFIVLIVFGLALIITSRKKNKQNEGLYNYRANFWSSMIGILFGASLLAVSIGFSYTFIKTIYLNHLEANYPFVLILLYVFPLVPFGFLIYFIVHLMKTLKYSDKVLEESKDEDLFVEEGE